MLRKRSILILIILFIAACSASTPTPIPPDQIILRTVDRMTGTSGFHFSIDRSGASAYLDTSKLLSLSRLEGEYIAPDNVQATVRIVLPGIVTDISFVGIGENQWQTNPLSGAWESLPPNAVFNPARLFDPDIGLQAILETDLSNLEILGNAELDTLPGHSIYHMRGKLEGEKTFDVTYGLIGPEIMDIEMWIEPDTFELHRMNLIENAADPDNMRTWRIDFWDFDLDTVITPPE